MYCYGATFFVAEERRREEILDDLLRLTCERLHLCSGCGCGCVTGTGERLCSETYHGGERSGTAVATSEGPGWRVVAYRLNKTVHVEVYLDEVPGAEAYRAWYSALRELGEVVAAGQTAKAGDI